MPLKIATLKPRNRERLATWMYRISMPVTQVLLVSNTSYPLCPRCDCTLEREYMRFCNRCGQRLGWELLDFAEEITAARR